MLMMKSSGRQASTQYACGSAGLHPAVHPGALRAHTWFWAALFALGRSVLAAYLSLLRMHTAGCLYVRLKMTDNECATLPNRNQCESGDHNNSPLSPGVDMLDPAKLQHVVVGPTTFRMLLHATMYTRVVAIQMIVYLLPWL